MKPGTICSKCHQPFMEDEVLRRYHGTIKAIVAKTNQIHEYDLCVICFGNLINECRKPRKEKEEE